MIRSSKTTLGFSNTGKRNSVALFREEYQRVVVEFIGILWEQKKIPKLFTKETTSQINSWLSARVLQCAAKQASGIVRGTRSKQRRRQWQYEEFVRLEYFKEARKLKKIIEETKVSKPVIESLNPELDSRFVKIDWESETSFDGWVTLTSLGNKLKIVIPIRKNKHFNELLTRGTLKPGLRLGESSIVFSFSIPDPEPRSEGTTLGIDIGLNKVFSSSDGVQSQEDIHGWNLRAIVEKINRCKPDSKGYKRAQSHRENYINWSLNQINLNGVKTLKREDIKNLRFGVKTSKTLRRWTYTSIFGKLGRLCEDSGVQILKVNPAFTSQRCSSCGWVQKSNRKGSLFKCKSCGFEHDADLNASRNIGLDLPPLGANWRSLPNRTGFFWKEIGRESVVPDTQGNG